MRYQLWYDDDDGDDDDDDINDDDDDDDNNDDDDDQHQFYWNFPKGNPPAAESSKAERAEERILRPNTGNQSSQITIDQLGPTGIKIVVQE